MLFRITIAAVILCSMNVPTQAAPPGEGNDAAMRVAEAYGIDGWDRIERLDFTFKVDLPNKDKTVSRRWTWWPKQHKVTWHRKDAKNVTYNREKMGDNPSKQIKQADKHFINDHYWLLFPFQPVWSNPQVTDEGTQPLPIGDGEATQLAVRYPDQGGYTPGDGYNLYINDENLIEQWQYLPGGDESKAKAHTWEKHRELGPIVVSLEHHGPDGKFHLWFDNVKAKLDNGETVTPE